MIVVVAHDRQALCATGIPLHMTYRPWQMAGRPMCNVEAHDMSNQQINVILTCFDVELHQKT